jgi:DnaJ-class molecular chaperone
LAEDPYAILGVARDATASQIRRAFLKLAKSSHPDLNPNDPAAEARFKAINAAHALLSDPEQRARFDRGEIDASGQERPPPEPPFRRHAYRDYAEGPAGGRYRAGPVGEGDFDDILAELLRAQRQGAGPRPGRDRRYALTIPFSTAIQGGTQRLTLPEGGVLDVRIPPGMESGQTLRLRGKGEAGEPPGDALIEITVAPHPHYRRVGRDLYFDLPVSLAEAVLGARIEVPTIGGRVTLTIPPGADTGTTLRLRGKGVPGHGKEPAGDAYATLQIRLGPADPALAEFLRTRAAPPAFDPRAGMEDMA